MTHVVASAAVSCYEFCLLVVTSSERPPSFILLEVTPAEGENLFFLSGGWITVTYTQEPLCVRSKDLNVLTRLIRTQDTWYN